MISHNEDPKMAPGNTHHDIYTTPIKDGAFLFHKSFYLTYQRLHNYAPEIAQNYLNAILKYAFEGQTPPDDNDNLETWVYGGLPTVFFQMDIDAGRTEL